jgi:hypothetical protein
MNMTLAILLLLFLVLIFLACVVSELVKIRRLLESTARSTERPAGVEQQGGS